MMAEAQLTAKVSTEGVSKAESDLKKLSRTAASTEKSANKLSDGFKSVGRNASAAIAAIDGPLGGVASRVSALTTVFTSGTAAASGFGVAIAAVGGALVIGTKNLDDYNVNLKRVNATIKATGDAVGFTAEQLQDQAAALALSTLTSTKEVQAAQAQLLTFNRVLGDTFTTAIELSQDLAEAGFGSITQNAVQLGKALQDPINGISSLTRVGVTFNNVQKEQIKLAQEAGDIFAAQAIVLEALESQVGGVAAAVATNTLAGDLDTLGQRFEEFTIRVAQSSNALTASQIVVGGWIKLIEEATNLLEGPTNSELFEENLDLIFRLGEAEQYLETLQKGSAEYDRQVAAVARLSGEIEANRQVIASRAEAENAAAIAAGEAQEREAEQRRRIQEELIAEQDRIAAEQAEKEKARLAQTFARNQAAAQQELQRLEAANDSELEAVDRREQQKLDLIESFRQQGLINQQEFENAQTEIEKTATQARADIQQAAREKELEADRAASEERKRIFEEENAAAIKAGEDFSSSLSQGLLNVVKDSESVGEALRGTIVSVSESLFQAATQQLIQQQVVDRVLGATFLAAKTAEASSTVAQAGLNAFAATAAIPVVGPALAPGAAAAATATASSLAAPVIAAAAAREQGGGLAAGQVSTIAERNQLEVIAPASASRVRTAQQMRSIMGENTSQPQVSLVVIDQSTGSKDFTQETDDDGRIILLIQDTVATDLTRPNSRISKSLNANTNAGRSR